jgi:lipopolysaccharide export system protein LptA
MTRNRISRMPRLLLAAVPALLLCLSVLTPPSAVGQAASSRPRRARPTPAAAPAVESPSPAAVTPELPATTPEDPLVLPPVDKGTNPPVAGAGGGETEILALQGATFSSKERVATFAGDVRVTNPGFRIACDKLTVYLRKAAPDKSKTPDADAAATPTAMPSPGSGKASGGQDATGTGGIDHAVAEGHVIIIQERASTDGTPPKVSVGRADRADFNNNTGDMVLRGMPTVEQNENTHEATSRETIMTLRKDNSMTTQGPSRTVIKQRKGNDVPNSSNPTAGQGAGGQPRN